MCVCDVMSMCGVAHMCPLRGSNIEYDNGNKQQHEKKKKKKLTHHFQCDHVAFAIALHVRGDARIVARLLPSDALNRQITGAHDHASLGIVLDGLALHVVGWVR